MVYIAEGREKKHFHAQTQQPVASLIICSRSNTNTKCANDEEQQTHCVYALQLQFPHSHTYKKNVVNRIPSHGEQTNRKEKLKTENHLCVPAYIAYTSWPIYMALYIYIWYAHILGSFKQIFSQNEQEQKKKLSCVTCTLSQTSFWIN